MQYLSFGEIASALFLVLLGAARYRHVVLAGTQPADRFKSAVSWARQIPAYFASTAWVIYVVWFIIVPAQIVKWDLWPLEYYDSELLVWIAIPLLAAGLWLFWYSHCTIGPYWSIQVQLKSAHRLITSGPYRYIRHPLYTALFLGYVGTALALQSWMLVAWFPMLVGSYLLFAQEEEKVMEDGFGKEYRSYCLHTGLFLPKWARVRADIFRMTVKWRAPAPGKQKQ
jgi:protein-S-isoprenylcysteine O-methyltransferase Ste14